jgi:EAL domain-containing protein (putative c-di-GMP-specific phosphodiesterase class I)
MKAKIYVAIQRWNSISTKTLIDQFGTHQSVTSSLSQLESDGLIRKSGEIDINGRVFSQWVAITNIDAIEAHKEAIEAQKKEQWIKRAQRMGWIDDQVAYFLTNHIFKKINFHDENAN